MAGTGSSELWWPDRPGPERTVGELLDSRVAWRGESTALVAMSLLAGAEVTISYRELGERAARMAGALAAAGVGRGDRVGIMFENDGAVEAHVTYHASHLLGAINVPLNTRYVGRELDYVLRFVAPAAIVFSPAFAPLLASIRPSLGDAVLLEAVAAPALGQPLGELLEAAAPVVERAALEPGEDADWIFTSGTTGKPKGVALSHGGSVACGYQSVGMWDLAPDRVYQSFAPFFTSTGSHTNLLSCLAAGCAYVIDREFDVVTTLDRMELHHTSSTFLISTVLALILERRTPAELEAYDFSALRRVCYGAQPSSAAFYRRLREEVGERWGVELVNIYGLTEGGTSGIMLVDADMPVALDRIGPYGLSIGRTGYRDWIEHTVLGPGDAEAAPGEVGELCLRGPSTMSRYAGDPEATANALRGGWLHTGDMATRDDDGFVYFVDRNAQLIRRGGLNISSAEVEAVLLEHPGVAEVAVVPLPNPVLGSDVRGVVVPEPGTEFAAEELIAFCAERLADYKVPVQIDFVAALPRNGMNRVMKGVLTGEDESLAQA
jgi:acyl-CoA synthetase (AMP-forming)/AMP-acid ligase II